MFSYVLTAIVAFSAGFLAAGLFLSARLREDDVARHSEQPDRR